MTKAIAPTAMAPILPTPPPVTAEPSCCTDLSLRVQAVWNAFLTLLAAIVDWCACQIHGPTGKSQPLVIDFYDQFPRFAPARLPKHLYPKTAEEKAEDNLRNLVEAFDRMTSAGRFLKSYIPEHLPLQTRTRQIKAAINNERILFQVANTQHTLPGEMEGYNGYISTCNKTRLLLKLGANPNQTSDNAWGYVPLHCAVLSGCTLAYDELRKAGANPWIREYRGYRPGHTPIALAYHMLASNMPLDAYFWQVAVQKDHSLVSYFPDRYFTRDSYDKPGTLADIQKMIDFEVEKATDPIQAAQPVHVDRPIAKLIASYYLSGDPNEHGANLVKDYESFYFSSDPNTKGVQDLLKANPTATVTEQLAMIQKSVETSNELFLAVNPATTSDLTNRTELFLMLGANPNKRATLGSLQNFTPLHAAVLTRSPLAYKTLRAFGADPTMRLGSVQDGDTCIEMAQRMLAANPKISAQEYFRDFVLQAGIPKIPGQVFDTPYSYDLQLFPGTYVHAVLQNTYASHGFGTEKDLQEILDYERMLPNPTAYEVYKHSELPADIAITVAEYAQE